VVVGDDADNPARALNEALDQARAVKPFSAIGNGGEPLVSFKISEQGAPINSSYRLGDGSPTYWKDAELSILKTIGEEMGHTQLFL
jgi:hypothetical protein